MQYGNADFFRSQNIKITKNQINFSLVVPESHSDFEIFAIFSEENSHKSEFIQKTIFINNDKKLAKIHIGNPQTHYKNFEKIQPKISIKSADEKPISGQVFVEIVSENNSYNNFLDSVFANIPEQYFLKFKDISAEKNNNLPEENRENIFGMAKNQVFAQVASLDSKGEITLDIPNNFLNGEYYMNVYSYSSGGIFGHTQSNFEIISDAEISHNIPKNVFP